MRKLLHKTVRIISTSAVLTAVAALVGVVYAFFNLGHLSWLSELLWTYIFNFCLATGGFVTLIGLVAIIMLPINLGKLSKSKLNDHTTYASKLMEDRESKRARAFEILYTGICIVLITGIVELIVHLSKTL